MDLLVATTISRSMQPLVSGMYLLNLSSRRHSVYLLHPAIDILESLNPVKRGHNRSVLPCMDGTRKQVMEEFDQWLKDDEAPNVLWISGHPGVGKSSIAASLESRLANEDERKQSSFFFQRDDVNLTNPAAVWRTVAYDLAQGGGKFADNLVQFLKKKRIDPANVDIASHFRFLIKDPLLKSYDADSPSNTIPIIIIDALDECSSEGSQRWTFLETLTQWKQLPAKFKLIVTSRDEDSISLKLRSISRRISLVSGGEVDPETNGDIRHFFEKRFKDELCCLSLPEWLGDRVLNQLTTQAAGLFIWAETVVKFVRKDLYESQLELVLRGDIGEENHVAELYEKIIKFSFPKPSDDVRNIFKLVVSTIVLAKAPLRIDDVAKILEKKRSEVDLILSRLSSVISGRSTDQCLRIGHLSFTQFICDSKRGSKPDQWFVIDRDTGSQELAMACFRLMKDGLQFNICGLQSSHLLNNDVVDLSQRIEKKISSTLFYSCRFWAAHLLDTTIESDGHGHETLMKEVEDFLYARALFWLEVVSLKKEVTGANIALLTASTRIRVRGLFTVAAFHNTNYHCRRN
jgi:DNA polymerase III delta prime subunit